MQRLSETWRQQIVIENKVGANTQIGAEAVRIASSKMLPKIVRR
jgi:tripartite-type tricarboxylate transporter receptor subunit TctC